MTRTRLLLLICLCSLQLSDLGLTCWILAHGGRELNPLILGLGLWKAKLLALGAAIWLGAHGRRTRMLWSLAGLYALIVGWNIAMIVSA